MSLHNLSVVAMRVALSAKHNTFYINLKQGNQPRQILNASIEQIVSSTILPTINQKTSADEIADSISLQLSDDLDFQIDSVKRTSDSDNNSQFNLDHLKGPTNAILGPISAALTLTKLEQTITSLQTKCKSTMPFWAAFKASLGASYTKNIATAPKDQLTETLGSQMSASLIAGSADTLLSSWFNVKKILLQLDPTSRLVKQPTVKEMLQLSQKGMSARGLRNSLNSTSLMILAPFIQQTFPQQWQQDYKHSVDLASSMIAGMISGAINTPIDTLSKQIVASINFDTFKTQPAKEVIQQVAHDMYQDGVKNNARLAGLNAVRSAGGFMALAATGIITNSAIESYKNTSPNSEQENPDHELTQQPFTK